MGKLILKTMYRMSKRQVNDTQRQQQAVRERKYHQPDTMIVNEIPLHMVLGVCIEFMNDAEEKKRELTGWERKKWVLERIISWIEETTNDKELISTVRYLFPSLIDSYVHITRREQLFGKKERKKTCSCCSIM